MKNVFTVFFFATIVLLVPHGFIENIAMLGVILCAVIWVWQAFRPTSFAPDLRQAPDEPGDYSKKSNSSNGASR